MQALRGLMGSAPAPVAGAGVAPAPTGNNNDLFTYVSDSSHAVNVKSGSVKSLLAGSNKLTSDVDAQMILTVEFSQTVNISSVTVGSEADGEPTSIRLYTNRTTFGFDDAEDTPVQELVFEEGKKSWTFKLKPGKFNGVNSLTLFVDREGGDHSTISALKLTGGLPGVADVKKIQKC